MSKRFVVVVLAVALAVAGAGAGAPAWSLTTLAPGWEQHFTITWDTVERHGRTVLRGEVANHFSLEAERVQLLVEGLDQAGQVVSQRVVWVDRPVAAFGRSYFETAVPDRAASYRVGVYAFIWGQHDMK
jgi:hypothetical protein